MIFISNFFNFGSDNLIKLEKQADDVLELPNKLRAYRIKNEIVIVDTLTKKIVNKFKDTLPSNPARATLEIIKKLKLATTEDKIQKTSDVWTCGFREDDARWVWYKNSQPKITVNFKEAYAKEDINDKLYFFSARYGTSIVNKLKTQSIEEIAKSLNASILERSYTPIKCSSCNAEENYTIDDIVDENKNAKYESNFVICQNCNTLIKLIK